MKALILAAGFGTRLRPYTEHTPKPLFPIVGRPLLDVTIQNLQDAGCTEIMVNTHHLHEKIESFISNQNYSIPVHIQFEHDILGTGGAIKNLAHFWDNKPFIVINSDIVTDINIKKVYEFHMSRKCSATLVLHDYPEFNNVLVHKDRSIVGFHYIEENIDQRNTKRLAFTGIQVLDASVLNYIPKNTFFSSIDAYRKMITTGLEVNAFISEKHYWQDIGSPEQYIKVIYDKSAPNAFCKALPDQSSEILMYLENDKIEKTKLKGDGSDRSWYRLTLNKLSLIMVKHGIQHQKTISEFDSFISIGNHLNQKGIPVPPVYYSDRYSGLAFLEDLGDVHLQTVVENCNTKKEVIECYKSIINLLIQLSIDGEDGFDKKWAYQTKAYDKNVIIDFECRYFINAFVNRYLGMDICFEDVEDDFLMLAEKTLAFAVNGFMHRDMQSRNIMVKNKKFYFIDFQGGRLGPLQYDLASLLIDPYVKLSESIQDELLIYCFNELSRVRQIDKKRFFSGYAYCAITRNLQMLGAFGYLSREKGKVNFEKYIPSAIVTLNHSLKRLKGGKLTKLGSLVEKIVSMF